MQKLDGTMDKVLGDANSVYYVSLLAVNKHVVDLTSRSWWSSLVTIQLPWLWVNQKHSLWMYGWTALGSRHTCSLYPVCILSSLFCPMKHEVTLGRHKSVDQLSSPPIRHFCWPAVNQFNNNKYLEIRFVSVYWILVTINMQLW